MSIKPVINLLLFTSVLAFARIASAGPLNVAIDDPPDQPIFIGYETATFPIHVEPSIAGGTVNNLSGEIRPLLTGFQLVGHDCPGSISAVDKSFTWTGIGNLVGGASIDCAVELRPTTPRWGEVKVSLNMYCGGCGGADDEDWARVEVALAPDVVATINTNLNPSVGSANLTVVLRNKGEATAHDINVSLYGTASLFSTMTQTGVGKCLTGTTTGPDEVSWEVGFLDPGEQLICPFTFTIPSVGSYDVNLNAPAWTAQGVLEPDLDDNYASVTLNATNLVVNTHISVYPDANPGDGICADTKNGACSLRAAIEEANALPGYQVVSVPYRASGYYLTGLAGYLTITDPMRLSGVPDAATGNYPFITRFGSNDTGLIRINTGSTVATVLEFLDLRGHADHQVSVDGAVVQQSSGHLWIRNAKVSDGWTSGSGGGIRGTEGLRLSGVEIFNNTANVGGGLFVAGVWNNGIKDATLDGVAFHDNHAIDYSGGGSGGGATFLNAEVSIERSSFVDNTAERWGGGLQISTRADLVINNSTISGNTADARGGGIYHGDGSLSVNFSTIAHNQAGPGSYTVGDGGGIWNNGLGATDIRNSILAFNYARTSNGGPIGLVVSGNCHGVLYSQGYNTITIISSDTDCSSVGSSNLDSNDVFVALAPLQTTDIGIGYHRLTAVNNEIDRASPNCGDIWNTVNTEDILRIRRPSEGDGTGEALCDRGAVESAPLKLHIVSTETGLVDWQILVDGDRPACLDVVCSYYFIPVGSQVTLTPDPSIGTSFDGWGGDCSGTAACTLQMSQSRDVSASFSATGHILEVWKSGAGNVTSSPAGISCGADCMEIYAPGTEVTLTASPSAGWALQNWSGDCSGSGACVVTMDAARSITAIFGEPWTLDVSIVGNGSVSSSPAGIACPGDCEESYLNGASITLNASAQPGHAFDHWSGDCSGSGACVVQIDQARSVTAHFVVNARAIFADGFE